ncbi:ferredoxin--NADP reductase [Azospirillum griseum]|uniref:ferredoxin--NADP(+) reductase n=1 Tax=Azospirillum griseum TaxID=2496639 RepID=A0A3S0JJY8_9PROT|nr:ferredoxin--NADP reductase [Azospirillum griseum]RTR22029.1 ferredoxin--NADP reductase [Azospirillum griseum]
MSNLIQERVLRVHHWTDTLFTFTTTRDPSFRFLPGQFTMIGLEVNGRPLLRAYSLVSAHYEETLEFFSIKVPDGPLTSRLQHLKEGDTVLVNRKATGTLISDNLTPGRNLYLLSTGTGLAPFLSIIKDPELYEKYERVILTHGTRTVAELAYDDLIQHELPENEFFGEQVKEKLLYYPTVTREPFRNSGRLTTLMETGKLYSDLGLPELDPAHDRVMICGSPAMLAETSAMMERKGFVMGTNGEPGNYVIEKAFVER